MDIDKYIEKYRDKNDIPLSIYHEIKKNGWYKISI